MTIITKEWNKKTGELESENLYETVSKKGKDGLMHHVSSKKTILKGREIKWDDLKDNPKQKDEIMKKITTEKMELDFVRHWNSLSMYERTHLLPWVPLWKIKMYNDRIL